MDFIVPLYAAAGIFAILISMPSIIQLIKTKRSDELSLTSWSGWLMYQAVALVYSLHLQAWPLILINSLWISFYFIMIFFIVRYRRNPQLAKARVQTRRRR